MRYVILLGCLLLLAACDSSTTQTTETLSEQTVTDQSKNDAPTMEFVPSTDRDYSTLKAAGVSNSLIFDLSNLQVHSQVEFWIEHYVDGKLQEKMMSFQSEAGDQNAAHQLYFTTMDGSNGEQTWTVAFREGDNVASGKASVQLDATKPRMTRPQNEISLSGEPNTIAYIMVGEGRDQLTVADGKQLDEDGVVISTYPDAFLLKCRLS